MALQPVSAGQIIAALNQNAMVRLVNSQNALFREKGDTVVAGPGGVQQRLSVPDGEGERARVANLVTKQIAYQRFQKDIPSGMTEPPNLQVGDLWVRLP